MSERYELITEQEMADLREIDRLLDEANQHSLDNDGYCKSSEGAVILNLGNHWDRIPGEGRKPIGVSIYAYLLGPHRNHDFDNTTQALEVVKQWHWREMAHDYVSGVNLNAPEDDLYLAIEKERQESFERAVRAFEEEFAEVEEPE